MKKTITLLQKQHDVLTDVIRWLDENKFSNTDIRSKVDVVLNHSDFYEIKSTQEDQEFIISEDKKLIVIVSILPFTSLDVDVL